MRVTICCAGSDPTRRSRPNINASAASIRLPFVTHTTLAEEHGLPKSPMNDSWLGSDQLSFLADLVSTRCASVPRGWGRISATGEKIMLLGGSLHLIRSRTLGGGVVCSIGRTVAPVLGTESGMRVPQAIVLRAPCSEFDCPHKRQRSGRFWLECVAI